MNEDARRSIRRKADQLIEVVDGMTKQSMGRIADLSDSGLMLLANSEICVDGLFQCELHFHESQNITTAIHVGMQELWQETSHNDGVNIIGFRFIDISIADKQLLKDWSQQPQSGFA